MAACGAAASVAAYGVAAIADAAQYVVLMRHARGGKGSTDSSSTRDKGRERQRERETERERQRETERESSYAASHVAAATVAAAASWAAYLLPLLVEFVKPWASQSLTNSLSGTTLSSNRIGLQQDPKP